MSTESKLIIGQRVQLTGKSVCGTVAYIGLTNFASGQWVGLILDEPKGKNNGTVKEHTYFNCAANYGVFIRPSQVLHLNDKVEDAMQKVTRVSYPEPSTPFSISRQVSAMSSACSQTKQDDIVSPTVPFSISKQSSFVETGFLEILRPQFTMGPIRSPTFSVSNAEPQPKNGDLRLEVLDLTARLESLRKQKLEDEEKLREFNILRVHCDQLKEFKVRIMESHSAVQKHLQRARREIKELLEFKSRHDEEKAELVDSIELLTLDKEMAEEKAETLQLELDDARERIEELSIELQILRNGIGTDISTNSAYDLKHLQEQNVRLKETVIRMRNLSVIDKDSIQKLTKDLDVKKSEVLELQRTKEQLSEKIDELELQILDLLEQVDAAIGAEEMVEQLSDKKLELEAKVKFLEEEVAGLEAIEEIHEQLIEGNNELERELRQELEKQQNINKDLIVKKEAALETVYDRDITIFKFRELVQSLNKHINDLKCRVDKCDDYNQEQDALENFIDFNQIFTESKASSRAIENDLREHQLQMAHVEIDILLQFAPVTFLTRGSDYDAIQTIIFVSRCAFKVELMNKLIAERFLPIGDVDKDTLVREYSVHQFAFRSQVLHTTHNLLMLIFQMQFVLNRCSTETLLRTTTALPEMLLQEKNIDSFLELLKLNKVDENTQIESLEKSVLFFQTIYLALMTDEDIINDSILIKYALKSIQSAFESILTNANVIQSLIRVGDEYSKPYILLQYFIENSTIIINKIKHLNPRLVRYEKNENIGITKNQLSIIRKHPIQLTTVVNIFHASVRQTLQSISNNKDTDIDIDEFSINKMQCWQIISRSCQCIYNEDHARSVEILKEIVATSDILVTEIKDSTDNDKLVEEKSHTKFKSPISHRAEIARNQLEISKSLASALEDRENEIKQLKKNFKVKQNDLSEMQVRRDVAERKYSKLKLQYDMTVEQMQKQLDELGSLLHQNQLELDKAAFSQCIENQAILVSPNEKESNFDNPIFTVKEIKLLQRALVDERIRRLKLESLEFKRSLNSMQKITIPQKRDDSIKKLDKELIKAKHEWIRSFITNIDIDRCQKSHSKGIRSKDRSREDITTMTSNAAKNILDEYYKRKPHRIATSDFGSFPTKELFEAFKN